MLVSAINLYKDAYSGLSRRMWLLAAVMLVNRCGTMVLPFMTLYCNDRGYTASQGGLAVAIYGIGAVFGAFLGGKLSDRFGFYFIQVSALCGGGIMFILLGLMDSYLGICICIFFTSMINESFRPANASAIAHYSTAQNRTQSFSLVRLAINLGWGIGSALAGILASNSYHLLFWVDGLTNICAGILLLAILPAVTLAQQQKGGSETKGDVKSAYHDKNFMIFTVFMLLFAFCFFQLFTTVPLYFKEGLHLNEFWIGVVMSVNGILIALFEMVIVFKLEGTRPYLRLMSLGSILIALSYFLLNMPFGSGLLIALTSTFFITIGEILGMPFMNSYYIARSTPENRGQYAAIYTMAWSGAQVIGSLSGTQIAHYWGFGNLWWVIGGICLLTVIGFQYLLNRDPS
ncbi:MAG: MFS transporter [Chitinophagaceae bacterium]|nr:MFS transporter [Chitinophagaceae bacterium]